MTTKSTQLGIITFWTLKDTNRAALKTALDTFGLGDLCPEPVTAMRALRQALEEIYPQHLIRPLATDGFAVVREVRGNTDNDYATSRIVRIDSAESVQFDNNFSPDDARIEGAYRSRRETIIPARLGHTLSGLLVNNIRATLLRPTGGVYWLPDSGLPEWSKIIEAVETASPNSRVYIVRHDMDAESIRAVRDALINELTATCDQLTAQIQSGELGERALASKEREARDLMGKVSAYESILGGGLDSLRTMLSNVETTAANAIMTAAAQAQNRETTGV